MRRPFPLLLLPLALAACGKSEQPHPKAATARPTPPAIVIESPAAGASVRSPLRVRGTANTFEANFTLELRTGGRLVARRFVTATSGSGVRGTFDVTIRFRVSEETRAELVAYEPSAKDGSPLHTTRVPIGLLPKS